MTNSESMTPIAALEFQITCIENQITFYRAELKKNPKNIGADAFIKLGEQKIDEFKLAIQTLKEKDHATNPN